MAHDPSGCNTVRAADDDVDVVQQSANSVGISDHVPREWLDLGSWTSDREVVAKGHDLVLADVAGSGAVPDEVVPTETIRVHQNEMANPVERERVGYSRPDAPGADEQKASTLHSFDWPTGRESSQAAEARWRFDLEVDQLDAVRGDAPSEYVGYLIGTVRSVRDYEEGAGDRR
ncbi:hypothetical protein GCM10023403_50690 [Pseudonocardia benzenivorans]